MIQRNRYVKNSPRGQKDSKRQGRLLSATEEPVQLATTSLVSAVPA